MVRANYVNYSKNVTATPLFLERFFDNLLFGAKHELHNRDMHISKCQSDKENSPKCQIGPLDVTLEEKVLLEFVKANPKATQEHERCKAFLQHHRSHLRFELWEIPNKPE